jgi:hypothetical protein
LRPARKTVELTFRLGDEGTATVKGLVVWANGYGKRHVCTLPFGMGISFSEVPPEAAELIRRYVSRKVETGTSYV